MASTDNDFQITSYDPDDIKSGLIAFMKTKPDFVDFNYEGSALNTVIDLLTRNTHYIAFLANMTANESFLQTAQIRNNVVSHAQKLSYVPKSRTSATILASVLVKPAAPSTKSSITLTKGSPFITTIGGTQYTFISPEDVILQKNLAGNFFSDKVTLKQGQLLSQKFYYTGAPIQIPNKNIDSSTIKMYVRSSATAERFEFVEVDDITQSSLDENVFFMSQNTNGYYEVEFGKDILGAEPVLNAIVEIEYIGVAAEHANGLGTLIAGTTIGGYSNIVVTVLTPAYGGSEEDSIERIRFLAPRIFKAQNRAVVESDFVGLLLRDFPFIKSVVCWGGEKNIPPYYGRVFLSIIPIEGYNIVDAVKKTIEARLQKYTMMAIPVVVDANFVFLDLTIDYIFDNTKTASTFATIETQISDTVTAYNDNHLDQFDFWYNNSLLSDALMQIVGIESIQIKKYAYIEFETILLKKTKYSFSFNNVVQPDSFSLTGYIVDLDADTDKIEDDGLGDLKRIYTKNNVEYSEVVGTIDYLTGDVILTLQLLTGNLTTLKAYVEPSLDNFYTERNNVVAINSTSINRTTQKRV